MGDRANVLVGEWNGEEFSGVYLYTHWSGSELPWIVQSALLTTTHWVRCGER